MTSPSGRGNIPGAVRRVLAVTALGNFASSLFVRAIDPMIPQVAHDLVTDPATVALLTTGFALPYAILQPVLGPLADMIGKTRLMTICLGVLVINGFVSAAAPNFNVLMASRIASGIAAGGIFPIGLAIAGDLVPIHQRQVAISRLLAAGMLGNLLGTPMAGILGDLVGWRFVLAVVGFLCMATFIAAVIGFRGIAARPGAGIDLAAVVTGYRTIFRNPLAKYCFGAVMLEGTFMMGIFSLRSRWANGELRATIAGYRGLCARRRDPGELSCLLPRIGERGLILIGAGSWSRPAGWWRCRAVAGRDDQIPVSRLRLLHDARSSRSTPPSLHRLRKSRRRYPVFSASASCRAGLFRLRPRSCWIAADRGPLRRGDIRHGLCVRGEAAPPARLITQCAVLPDQLNPEPPHGRIVGDHWYVFDQRLRGEHPIKRVFVSARQPASKLAVRNAQRQRLPAVLGDHLIEAFGEARGDRELAQAEFRCNLMPGNSTHKDRRFSVAEDR
jgi:MFS family permease